jgi:hypothetical protein
MILLGKQEAEFPRQIQALLQQALQLRDRRQQEQISDHGVAVARGRLEARLDRSLQRCYRSLRNRRLANLLLRERDALFTFLNCPGLEATNWRAEQAIRPMVVARKVWGGNRTPEAHRRISRINCSFSGPTSTTIAPITHGKGERRICPCHHPSPICARFAGNHSVEAYIRHPWLPEFSKMCDSCDMQVSVCKNSE